MFSAENVAVTDDDNDSIADRSDGYPQTLIGNYSDSDCAPDERNEACLLLGMQPGEENDNQSSGGSSGGGLLSWYVLVLLLCLSGLQRRLCLMHWPIAMRKGRTFADSDAFVDLLTQPLSATWYEMEKAVDNS